ncbi:MAG: tetratricopeptide repeat protein, partial [Chloroherpetonaceae bacterium]|nr:tetratricopeptide repeat protein [Chloroherpetonaceae bacterium]
RALIAEAKKARYKEPAQALDLANKALHLIGEREDLLKEKADAWLLKGDLLLERSDHSGALAALQTALRLYESLNDRQGMANALNNIGNVHYRAADYESALRHYQQSLVIYQETGDKRGIAGSHGNIGNVHYNLSDYSKALERYQRCLELYEDIGDKQGVANALNIIGNVHYSLADYANALRYYQQSLEFCQEIGDKKAIALALMNIGSVHHSFADFDNALRYHQRSLAAFEDIGDKQGVALSFNNIGLAREKLGENENALECFKQSLAAFEDIGDKQGVANALNNIGNLCAKLGDYASALERFRQSLAISESVGDKEGIAETTHSLGETHLKLRSFDDAESHLRRALALADELGLKHLRFQTLQTLSDLYAQTRRYEEAYRAHIEFHRAQQEVFNAETQRKLAQLQVRFETEQARKQAELLQKEAEIFRLRNVELAQANENILSSIRYASRIQRALLPNDKRMSRALSEWFALYKPQAIVSGDFYWFYDFGETRFVAVGDCTGHGVPGAFMSLLGISFLNQVIVEKRAWSPAKALALLNELMRQALRQEKSEDAFAALRDGMDIALAKLEGNRLTFAGARRPLYVAQVKGAQTELIELKGDRASIGGFLEKETNFSEQTLELLGEERIYLTTDGYADIGNEAGKSYGRRRLAQLLKDIAPLPMAEQKARLEEEMRAFQGSAEQRDDITIFGFKFDKRKNDDGT